MAATVAIYFTMRNYGYKTIWYTLKSIDIKIWLAELYSII